MSVRLPLQLNRLRVLRQGNVAYDQTFHEGVNIIRGQNGSGKSTIADFIFFILGGEFDDWKEAAKRCDEIQAEIMTPSGNLTLRRYTNSKIAPMHVFFGNMEEARATSLESWQNFPIRRNSGNESFSQVLFRSLKIPEAKSEGASNITMHQLLRLCYSDQRTPATRLFRFEFFDNQNIREAVGDLVCGISGYEIYETGLLLRELEKQFSEVSFRLSSLLKALPPDEALRTSVSINTKISELGLEKVNIKREVDNVDQLVAATSIDVYFDERNKEQERIASERENIGKFEFDLKKTDFEIREVNEFLTYLAELTEKLRLSEATFDAIGNIEFVYCPACGGTLLPSADEAHCIVCNRPIDSDKEKSRYNQIRLDIEIQTRESKQLLTQKETTSLTTRQELRMRRLAHERAMMDFELKYGGANGPREAFLAERLSRIGQIDAEMDFLTRSLGIAHEIDRLNDQKSELQQNIDKLKQRSESLHKLATARRKKSFLEISNFAVSLLHSDMKRQEEFETAEKVEIDFVTDSMTVDGHVNFAESSNVFLKNSVLLSIFLSACVDEGFHHPRFLLIDNIEDKGMETARSHLFQRLIVEKATELEVPFQIIYTTSMMNPELELEDYVIGPLYTKDNRTLQLR